MGTIYMTVVHRRFHGSQLVSRRAGGTRGWVLSLLGHLCLCITTGVGDTRNKGWFVEIRYAS